MKLSVYTDVIIEGDKFLIVRSKSKEASALATLNRIERVVREGLHYAGDLKEYSNLSPNQLANKLKGLAASIKDDYVTKSHKACAFTRFFAGLANKEKQVLVAYQRIEATIADMPDELLQCIASFLPVKDIRALTQINKQAASHLQQAEVQRARNYGYVGNDVNEAREYLHELFGSIHTLFKEGYIPKSYVVYQKSYLFFHSLDVEATLKKFQAARAPEQITLKSHWNRALLDYARDGRVSKIKGLLLLGADLEVRNKMGATSLSVAASLGHVQTVKALISYGANLEARVASNGYTPLLYAARNGRAQVVKELVQAGADVNCLNGISSPPLFLAVYYARSKESAALLLENGAQVTMDQLNQSGYNALHLAIMANEPQLVRILLQHGADQSITTGQGQTVRQLAARHAGYRVRQLLQ